MSTANKSYGTWSSRYSTLSDSPESDIRDLISGGSPEWREQMEGSGSLDRMADKYRSLIDEALPAGVSLCGTEFIGPAEPFPGEFDGYPKDWNGSLDIQEIVSEVDLTDLLEEFDVDNV